MLTERFRELVKERLGKLDTAHSFLYLYLRLGKPSFSGDPSAYQYNLTFGDISVIINASYHEWVYFSLFIDKGRTIPYWQKRNQAWRDMYAKYADLRPFMPFAMIPFGPDKIGVEFLTEDQHKELLKKIGTSADEYYTPEQVAEIEGYMASDNWDKALSLLQPFEKKLYQEFIAQLTPEEVAFIRQTETLHDVEGLYDQCNALIDYLLTPIWLNDVDLNIKGYLS